MKTSIKTGKAIYEEIKRIEVEIIELVEGMDAVRNEMGSDSVPYNLLDKQYSEKNKEMQNLFSKEYESVTLPQVPKSATDLSTLGDF